MKNPIIYCILILVLVLIPGISSYGRINYQVYVTGRAYNGNTQLLQDYDLSRRDLETILQADVLSDIQGPGTSDFQNRMIRNGETILNSDETDPNDIRYSTDVNIRFFDDDDEMNRSDVIVSGCIREVRIEIIGEPEIYYPRIPNSQTDTFDISMADAISEIYRPTRSPVDGTVVKITIMAQPGFTFNSQEFIIIYAELRKTFGITLGTISAYMCEYRGIFDNGHFNAKAGKDFDVKDDFIELSVPTLGINIATFEFYVKGRSGLFTRIPQKYGLSLGLYLARSYAYKTQTHLGIHLTFNVHIFEFGFGYPFGSNDWSIMIGISLYEIWSDIGGVHWSRRWEQRH